LYIAHEVCDILENHPILMGIDGYFSEEVDEPHREVKILYVVVRDDVEEEPDEL
jgi:hypothetical protein